MLEPFQDVLLALAFLACGGHHILLRLLSLHLCNEYLSLPKKKKKKKKISGVCSSWLRGRDPSMTLEAFQHLWCHNHTLASIHTVQTSTEERLELKVHLSDSSSVPLF